MPHQNRVDPFGTLVRTAEKGTLMGNRGCLHDEQQQIVRHHQGRRWISCVLAFKGRCRTIMTPGHYTELFFLDEATALAAGHRPCAECQRDRFLDFRTHWAAANPDLAGGPSPLVAAIDAALHAERLTGVRCLEGRKRTYRAALDDLPDGTFVVLDDTAAPHLVLGAALYSWSFAGYGPAIARPGQVAVAVLTPPSTVRALAHGYRAGVALERKAP